MPVYEYKGVDKHTGRNVKGTKDAEGPKSLRTALKREGILVTQLGEQGTNSKSGDVDFKKLFSSKVSKLDIALMTRQLATLTKAGISLVESLTAVIEQGEKPDLKTALSDVRDQVNQGTSLSDAFKRHPKYFNTLFCNMVNAGEQSGTLENVLERLADFIEAQNKLRNKIIAAMAYPAFMALMFVGLVAFMMMVVVPKVTMIFENFGRALPWYTKVLIETSDFLGSYWWLIIIMIVIGVTVFKKWKNSPKGARKWDSFVLEMPLFGKLMMMVAISRFAKTLSTMLSSGIPLLTAMDITKGVLGNLILSTIIEEASSSISEGESIAEPLKASGRFPPIVTHMIAIGERSGQLEQMLENVASAYDTQVDTKVTALTSIMEPLMIVIMGIVAGSIAFAILMPLIQMNEMI